MGKIIRQQVWQLEFEPNEPVTLALKAETPLAEDCQGRRVYSRSFLRSVPIAGEMECGQDYGRVVSPIR